MASHYYRATCLVRGAGINRARTYECVVELPIKTWKSIKDRMPYFYDVAHNLPTGCHAASLVLHVPMAIFLSVDTQGPAREFGTPYKKITKAEYLKFRHAGRIPIGLYINADGVVARDATKSCMWSQLAGAGNDRKEHDGEFVTVMLGPYINEVLKRYTKSQQPSSLKS